MLRRATTIRSAGLAQSERDTDGVAEQETATHTLWHTLQTHLRKRRFLFIRQLLTALPPGYELLDVGGTQEFWRQVDFCPRDGTILLYNLVQGTSTSAGITSAVGDGRAMPEFAERRFDVVFSNSVIEHAGTYQQQQQMAREIQRVGQRYCVQTPNRYFPIEPHVLWPGFQFLPSGWQIFILTHSRSPWGWRIVDRQEAERYIRGIRLLNERELRTLFPGAHLYREKFLGLTKSFLIYKGW